jgi:hypothetical protein
MPAAPSAVRSYPNPIRLAVEMPEVADLSHAGELVLPGCHGTRKVNSLGTEERKNAKNWAMIVAAHELHDAAF